MKKFFLGIIAMIAVILTPVAALAGYSAIAVGEGGAAFVSGYSTMDRARNAAVRRCRRDGYGSCSISVAERDHWYFSAGKCNGHPYAGASPRGAWRAKQIVGIKGNADGYYNCRTFMNR